MRKQRFITSPSLVRKERTEIAKTCEVGQIEELIQIVKGQWKFVYTERILLCHFIHIYGEQWISVVIIEEIKTKITTEFKVRERSERDGIKEKLARNKDSEVQKHASFIKKRLDTI